MDRNKTLDLLLKSFDVLKDDFGKNGRSLAELIGKTSKIDKSIAEEMWCYLLKKHKSHLSIHFTLTGIIYFYVQQKIGVNEAINLVINNKTIKESWFLNSAIDDIYTGSIVYNILNWRLLEEFNEIFELIDKNKVKRTTTGIILERAINVLQENNDTCPPDIVEIILKWVDRVDNIQDKARLQVILIDFID